MSKPCAQSEESKQVELIFDPCQSTPPKCALEAVGRNKFVGRGVRGGCTIRDLITNAVCVIFRPLLRSIVRKSVEEVTGEPHSCSGRQKSHGSDEKDGPCAFVAAWATQFNLRLQRENSAEQRVTSYDSVGRTKIVYLHVSSIHCTKVRC